MECDGTSLAISSFLNENALFEIQSFQCFDSKPEIVKSRRGMSQIRKVRKAVFPVAGLGTRFLPATKAVPKEMLTVVDKPVIQYVVDEALEAGIEHLIFVTGRSKAVIEDYFDIQVELEQTLRARNKTAELTLLESILPLAGSTSFTRQQEPLGLGHAVWCARELVGNEPFALLLPDMIMKAEKGCMKGVVEPVQQSAS